MQLTFENPSDARDRLRPSGGEWPEWFSGLPRQPEFAVVWSGPSVNGHSGAPVRVGGYFVEPPESVIGLRPFDDAIEGTVELESLERPVPYVFFEFEKILRMMLHQSGLAFEILSSPHWLYGADEENPCSEARAIVECAATGDLLAHYREVTDGSLDDLRSERDLSVGEILRMFRSLLTGVAAGRGRSSLDLRVLAEALDVSTVSEIVSKPVQSKVHSGRSALLEEAEALFAQLDSGESALPQHPDGYDDLNEVLVRKRT